jgi:hypothetical protein
MNAFSARMEMAVSVAVTFHVVDFVVAAWIGKEAASVTLINSEQRFLTAHRCSGPPVYYTCKYM